MKEEYIIINKTALEKMREELNKGSAHWDGVYVSDYQQGQIDLIDVIISSQSTPLVPEIEKAFDAGRTVKNYKSEWKETFSDVMTSAKYEESKDYISNLKLDI